MLYCPAPNCYTITGGLPLLVEYELEKMLPPELQKTRKSFFLPKEKKKAITRSADFIAAWGDLAYPLLVWCTSLFPGHWIPGEGFFARFSAAAESLQSAQR